MLESVFNKVGDLQCFPVNFAKFLRTFFSTTPPVAAFASFFLHNLAYPSKPLRVVATPS